jgi:poly(3-hydroxybutyrate) depolymerase
MKTTLLVALAGVLVVVGEAQAQTARQEFYPLQSVTLSDTDFLTGKKDGVRVTLAGTLRFPKLGPEKLPAVVLLHGSGGLGGSGGMIDEWSRELNEIGIATFAVDSFSGRGIIETVTDQTRLGRLNMVIDAYRALDLLSKHSQIDASRIGVMGFSRGGQSSLYSSLIRMVPQKDWSSRHILVSMHRVAPPIAAMTLSRSLFDSCTAPRTTTFRSAPAALMWIDFPSPGRIFV